MRAFSRWSHGALIAALLDERACKDAPSPVGALRSGGRVVGEGSVVRARPDCLALWLPRGLSGAALSSTGRPRTPLPHALGLLDVEEPAASRVRSGSRLGRLLTPGLQRVAAVRCAVRERHAVVDGDGGAGSVELGDEKSMRALGEPVAARRRDQFRPSALRSRSPRWAPPVRPQSTVAPLVEVNVAALASLSSLGPPSPEKGYRPGA
jgi:hypothetical protein